MISVWCSFECAVHWCSEQLCEDSGKKMGEVWCGIFSNSQRVLRAIIVTGMPKNNLNLPAKKPKQQPDFSNQISVGCVATFTTSNLARRSSSCSPYKTPIGFSTRITLVSNSQMVQKQIFLPER